MYSDLEENVRRELRDVAAGVQIPAMPALPPAAGGKPASGPRHWPPLLAAAAVVLIVLGALGVVATLQGDMEPAPAPAPTPTAPTPTAPTPTAPTESPTPADVKIPTSAPSLPYVLDQQLYVGGETVAGDWWSVEGVASGWVAIRTDGTWWWGNATEHREIAGFHDVPPALSPNGRYLAEIHQENGSGVLSAFDLTKDGEKVGSIPVELGSRQDGSTVTVRAVTDDGTVVVQGTRTALLWLPLADGRTVDLAETAPDTVVLGSTTSGVVATTGKAYDNGASGQPYLAQLTEDGQLTATGDVPAHDLIAVSPGVTTVAWAEPATLGGEVTTFADLEAQTLDGALRVTLQAPTGWSFAARAWTFEDDDLIVVTVARGDDERLARCSVRGARCVLVQTP